MRIQAATFLSSQDDKSGMCADWFVVLFILIRLSRPEPLSPSRMVWAPCGPSVQLSKLMGDINVVLVFPSHDLALPEDKKSELLNETIFSILPVA